MSWMTVHGLVGAFVGFFSALTLVTAGWIMMQPVSAKNTIAYHGVVTPACERMAGQTGGDEWTPSGVGADCSIEFREDVSGASVFVFGMGSVASPLSVSVGKKSISFLALGPNVSGNGFSFLVIR